MSYFSDHYSKLTYPRAEGELPGFRPAQLGAIHAAAAHFEMRSDPGIITMPTGSGKTAVLIASAFVLRAQRVLVVVPSRLLREQIAEEITSLQTLKTINAIPDELPAPRVFVAKSRISSDAEWEALREYDVVIGTIHSISPGYMDIPQPALDLFDLVLVDESHHSPATTWASLLQHYAAAKQLLFTATPFRQDQREIKGRFIYTYDLKRAYDDQVFGQIAFEPVACAEGQNSDIAIARAAELAFIRDRGLGFHHRVMVRTDSIKRAKDLADVYSSNTALRLELISGSKSLKSVKEIISKLRSDELDGIICVDMLGEGFNFPSLKIAAVHSPHRSLGITLQFIGRFARTVGENLGPATFLAVPSEIEIEAERLYDSRSVWQDLVQNLSATRVNQEANIREVLETFEKADQTEDLGDISLYVLEPYFHVKVLQLNQTVDLNSAIEIPSRLTAIFEAYSAEHTAKIFITRQITQPRWTSDDRLATTEYDMCIFFQDEPSGLLFICSSKRSSGFYGDIEESLDAFHPKPLHLARLNKALNELQAAEFFNVGMRNRVSSNTMESYRIISGSNADRAIQKSDGRLYHRGHVFGRATEDGELITIGISSASKIWSNRSGKISDLIDWCTTLARRMSSASNPAAGSGLDHLDLGEELTALPVGIIAVEWPSVSYHKSLSLIYSVDGARKVTPLLDCSLTIASDQTIENALMVNVASGDGLNFGFTFSLVTNRLFEPIDANQPIVTVATEREEVDFIHFVNDAPLELYTADMSRVVGNNFLRAVDEFTPLNDDQLVVRDWASAGVNIQEEFGPLGPAGISIQDYMHGVLVAGEDEVVYCDHGTGEIADFISFGIVDDRLLVRFWHCKKAGGAEAGHRVADIYEVSQQTVKSLKWANKLRLLRQIRQRSQTRRGVAIFHKGSLRDMEQLLGRFAPASIDFQMIVVQPGILKAGLPNEHLVCLASSNDFLLRAGLKSLSVWSS